ncbi:MAG: restriction endonuclease subunit S [Planctomycetota bacterium]
MSDPLRRWKTVALAEACEVVNGGTPKTREPENWDGPHQWVTPAEMGNRITPVISETARTLSDIGLESCSAKLIPADSVIMSSRAPIGHLVLNAVPMAFNQGCKGIIPGEEVEQKYLYYFLYANVEMLNGLGTGATFKELSATKLKAVSIPLPPLSEQRRIVSVLDAAFAGLATAEANTRQNLTNTRELFERAIGDSFAHLTDNERTPLGEIADFKNGLNYTQSSKGQSIRVVGVGDFGDNDIAPLDAAEYATIDGELDDGYRLTKDDVVIVRSNGSKHLVGRCMLIPDIDEATSFSGFVIRARVDRERLIPDYLLEYLKLASTRDTLTREGGGANISNINQKKLSRLTIPVPEQAIQKQIVEQVQALKSKRAELVDTLERKLAALAALKQSLLHRAFHGELMSARSETAKSFAEVAG